LTSRVTGPDKGAAREWKFMSEALPLAVRYDTIHEFLELSVHRADDELFVPCRLPGVLALAPGTPLHLSVRFADDPERLFLLNGVLRASQDAPRAGIRFAFSTTEPESRASLYRYVLSREQAPVERRERRHGARLKVTCWAPDRRIDAYTEDVSAGGAFIGTSSVLPVGTVMELHLTAPLGAPIDVAAKVVHVSRTSNRKGMGLQFYVGADARRALETLVGGLEG
jgi:uncharacterized protein (TIGR02266 family)